MLTILGSTNQSVDENPQIVALPYVYSLLETKEEIAYSKVFEIVREYFKQLNTDFEPPVMIMTNFEVPTINSARNIMSTQVKACFFLFCGKISLEKSKEKGCR